MDYVDLGAVVSYLKTMKVVYPAVEWRIKLNGKVQEVDEEDKDEDNKNNARHANASFALIASVLFLYFFEIM